MYSPDLGVVEDKFVYVGMISKELKKLGITLQIYYDIVVCGYTSISDRPTCKYCGTTCTFKSIPSGYRMFCNDSCKKKWENETFGPTILSEESRKKVSQSLIKMYRTEEGKKLRENISKSKKEMWKDPNSIYNDPDFRERKRQGFIKLLEDPVKGKIYRENLFKAMMKVFSNRDDIKYLTGSFKSNRFGELVYLSSYELKFIEELDKDSDVILLENTKFSVSYVGVDKKYHEYFPDFTLSLLNFDKQIIVEIKPNCYLEDETVLLKRNSAIEYCKNNNLVYIFITEDELFCKDGTKLSTLIYNKINTKFDSTTI